jgi:hypothetical protein
MQFVVKLEEWLRARSWICSQKMTGTGGASSFLWVLHFVQNDGHSLLRLSYSPWHNHSHDSYLLWRHNHDFFWGMDLCPK